MKYTLKLIAVAAVLYYTITSALATHYLSTNPAIATRMCAHPISTVGQAVYAPSIKFGCLLFRPFPDQKWSQ